jgi:hypothetical protein
MSVKISAREELVQNLRKFLAEQDEILRKYVPAKARERLIYLEWRIRHAHEGFDLTDPQLEWDRAGGMDRCPISVPVSTGDDPPFSIKKLCKEVNCPQFKSCWATKQLEAPWEMITSGDGPADTKPHPTFKEN